MKYIISILFLTAQVAFAQGYGTGLPMPGLPKSVGPKPMSGSTSVTFATDQIGITVNANSVGKVPFARVRNVYSSISVNAASYLQLLASTSLPTTSLDIFDSSGQTMAIAFGAAGSESNQFFVYPGGNGLIPIAIPQGTRVSVIAISPPASGVTATASSGEIDVNFYD